MTFCVGKCRVSVGVPFLAVVALLLALDRSGAAQAGLACAALHEAAHLAAMRFVGEAPREVRFTPFGIDIVRSREGRSYGRDALVSLAGPLANLAAFGVCRMIPGEGAALCSAGNFLLFALNALPIAPLDGGQALGALLRARMEPEKAERIVGIVSFCILLPLAAAGFYVLLQSRWNFTLLFAACYLFALLLMKREW